jgi:Reverse transcriptase (RNA-dependent DNA polymerase)
MPASVDEISKLIDESNDTSSLLKKCKFVLLPTITNIINYSLASGIFPAQFKSCSVHPLLKKPNCDKDDLSNYRPISHLSFLSKLTERLVKNRLTNVISDNNLLNSSQSAYTKYHSTETTLLAVHDHVIRAISQQQITCLCLLDFSVAFDTIDHSIPIERLSSWFGISGTVLNWAPHNQTLGSTFCVLDSTFWLGSTLRIRPVSQAGV